MWVIFAVVDPDPDSEPGSGSDDLVEFGSGSETLGVAMIRCGVALTGCGVVQIKFDVAQ
jgi:hypothetical protein